MGWCTGLPQHTTPKQTAKPKYSIGKSRRFYKRTRAATLKTRSGHIGRHSRLCWECLPIGLFSTKPVTYRLNWNNELIAQSRSSTWPTTKLGKKGSTNYKSWRNSRVKQFHDHRILRKEFQVGQKVLLFNSRLKLIIGKLHSRWDGPFIITKVLPYDELTRTTFQVNVQQLKIFHEGPTTIVGKVESISLKEPAAMAGTT
ncbi:hypothetical protein CR513_16586, partial [Mucuna pruriens]